VREISGTIGPCVEFPSDVLTSLTLISNKNTYGPFGKAEGIPFRSRVLTNKSIVGFFVRSETYVDAIGVYVKDGRETMKQEVPIYSPLIIFIIPTVYISYQTVYINCDRNK
jgi:hypothetical protein